MDHESCDACGAKTSVRPPNGLYLALIISFWLLSLALGFATATPDWGFTAALSWGVLAISVVLFARRATSWTCADCGSAVPPPARARPMHPRHA